MSPYGILRYIGDTLDTYRNEKHRKEHIELSEFIRYLSDQVSEISSGRYAQPDSEAETDMLCALAGLGIYDAHREIEIASGISTDILGILIRLYAKNRLYVSELPRGYRERSEFVRFVKDGHISEAFDVSNRKYLTLTEAGRRLLVEKIFPKYREAFRKFFSSTDKDTLKFLVRTLWCLSETSEFPENFCTGSDPRDTDTEDTDPKNTEDTGTEDTDPKNTEDTDPEDTQSNGDIPVFPEIPSTYL